MPPLPANLDRGRAVLFVIDLQERFRDLIDGFMGVVANSSRLIRFCSRLDIPIRLTEQYPKGLGRTIEEIARLCAEAPPPAEKLRFSARPALDTDREQVLVCGIETHVCVYQTVRDLLAEGKQVVVATDAVSSRRPSDRETALGYLRDLGAQLMSTEMILFEVLREAGTPEFKRVADILKE